jgi:hypothetical protein
VEEEVANDAEDEEQHQEPKGQRDGSAFGLGGLCNVPLVLCFFLQSLHARISLQFAP